MESRRAGVLRPPQEGINGGSGPRATKLGETVQCDASAFDLGAVLMQERVDGGYPIVYLRHVLQPNKKTFTVFEKNCLAVVEAIEKFRPNIEGYYFKVFTDHGALK